MAGESRPPATDATVEATSRPRTGLGVWSALVRVVQNALVERWRSNRLFDDDAFRRIEEAIAAGESRHGAEIRFALEQGLTFDAARRVAGSAEHALAAFALHGVWDTEGNTGILIFLQWPLHAIEIIGDRGVARHLSQQQWNEAVELIARACEANAPVDGIVAAIGRLNDALAQALPRGPDDRNELPDASIRL